MWNTDSRDTQGYTRQQMEDHITNRFWDGQSMVLLMHDVPYPDGLVQWIVDFFQQRNYQFVTMSQCYALCEDAVCEAPFNRAAPVPF